MTFEAFETSASSEKVLASKGALQWDFPGQAVSLPPEVYTDEAFQESLAAFLDQASGESVKQFAAVTYKACAPLPEVRDTADPTLVTSILMAILEANGASCFPSLLRKRVRDTVSFDKADKPWRRSPFYLTLRVALQRHLYRLLGPDIGRLYYKTIICIFLSTFLDNAFLLLPHEATHSLRQKLGRRLSKLELDRVRSSRATKDFYALVFKALGPLFEKSLASATRLLQSQWDAYNRRTGRIIRPLPRFASRPDVYLQLPLSGAYLTHAFYWKGSGMAGQVQSPADFLYRYEDSAPGRPFHAVTDHYLPLCKFQEEVIEPLLTRADPSLEPELRCVQLSSHIASHISTFGNAFHDYPELLSRQLLSLMELWVAMDKAATTCYRHLADYHPGFEPSMLDALQLPSLDELKRLHEVQSYIAERRRGWSGTGPKTIFAKPEQKSFAARYYDEASESAQLMDLRRRIECNAEMAREAKEEEWDTKSCMHEALVKEMASLSCVFTTEVDDNGYPRRVHKKGCRRHRLKWQAKQIEIEIFEYPLPDPEPEVKAAIFELACPKAFAAYRDASWLILSTFAYPNPENPKKVSLLRDYGGLQEYANGLEPGVTLASSVKSHLDSHYATSKFPVMFHQVCKPFALKLEYYDTNGNACVVKDVEPSFSHLFPLKLPSSSPFQPFQHSGDIWPSSNVILASQTRCPPDLNVHEFTAWQGLLMGTYCRWPSLLRELGSANINFSTDSTWAVVSRLILQAGPSSSGDTLRDTHSIFRDAQFCKKILGQVEQRLAAIQRNWREPVQMDMLISIVLKVLSLTCNKKICAISIGLLDRARDITRGWSISLRSMGNDHGHGPSIFAIWASVLSKRTFYARIGRPGNTVDDEALRCFIGASIDLQNNLVGQFETLPYNVRNAVLQDLISAYQFRHHVLDAVAGNQHALLAALNHIWPVPQDCMDHPSEVQVTPNSWWTQLILTSVKHGVTRHVHYNVLYGALLIDGQLLGALPPEYRRWPIIDELFGTQGLQILPSPLPGMSLVVNRLMPYGHWVHVGFRGDSLVIRAVRRGEILELINRDLFTRSQRFDLPAPLITGCYHWLNLNTGVLEIRQDDPWKSKKNNWYLNIHTRRATRKSVHVLVDPNSAVASRVFQNFHMFEYARNITVYQPPIGSMRVELKRLELDFFVNRAGLLQSPQLGAVIAESRLQDPGTWHGLRSKIVVRSVKNHSKLSILVPIGEVEIERDAQHVAIVIKNTGIYLKFTLNEVLGRIECPAEPRLLYTRALLHALTSHFLPDRFTGRTGVEEALYYLQTGSYLPWTSLPAEVMDILIHMAALTPARTYYPANLKCMETVHWDHRLPTSIQDDRYRGLIERICQRNTDLSPFTAAPENNQRACPAGDHHLESRALSRIYAYRAKDDEVYQTRDRRAMTDEHRHIKLTCQLLSEWPKNILNTPVLGSLLEKFPIIGGYGRLFDKVQLTDLLNVDFGIDWGALSQTAIDSHEKDKYRLMFMFSPMAFSSETPMELIRVLISFAVFAELKELIPPAVPAYNRFQLGRIPEAKELAELLKDAKVLFASEDQAQDTLRGQLALRRLEHDKEATRSCEQFVESILAQWPNKEIDADHLHKTSEKVFDRDEALALMLPEWGRLTENFELSQYLEKVQLVLLRHSRDERDQPFDHFESMDMAPPRPLLYPIAIKGGEAPSIQELLQKGLPGYTNLSAATSPSQGTPAVLSSLPNGVHQMPRPSKDTPREVKNTLPIPDAPAHIQELRRIIAPYRHSSSLVQKRYGLELEQSIDALVTHIGEPKVEPQPFNPTEFSKEMFQAKEHIRHCMERIRGALQNGDSCAKWLQYAGLWPRVTPITLLTELRSTSGVAFGNGTKHALVALGLAITSYQRLLRIEAAIQKGVGRQQGRQQQILDERNNLGHQNWSPLEYADWLLLEIDSDVMLRPEQVEVAQATISPSSGENSVLQLLMGKGKTSCILPMVALILADKRNLFRIIVPRPLLLQSAQVLQSKIGGLLNREVLHIPFSRKTPTERDLMKAYFQLHNHIQKHSGTLLALPEHVLSFKLSGVQRLCDGRQEEANMMIKAQAWLDRHARDVLDECDVSLAIRTQLIYPSGSQMTVDGHPLRWQTIQILLHLIRFNVSNLQRRFPQSIEVVRRPLGGYPLIYFLRRDAEERLIAELVQAICEGQTAILPCSEVSVADRKDLEAFISEPLVDKGVISKVTEMFKEKVHLMNVVRHLRGLFVHRILLSTMKKRWNVQYGLHPTRDPIAVPYQVSWCRC